MPLPANTSRRDLERYFNDTYVVVDLGGNLCPLYVEYVDDSDEPNLCGRVFLLSEDRSTLSDAAQSVEASWVLENPFVPANGAYSVGPDGVGYVEFIWDARGSRKGISHSMILLCGRHPGNPVRVLANVLKPQPSPQLISREFWTKGKKLLWRNNVVGSVTSEGLQLADSFSYLQNILNKQIGA